MGRSLPASVRRSGPWLAAAILASGIVLAERVQAAQTNDDLALAPVIDVVPDSEATNLPRVRLSDHVLVPAKPADKPRVLPDASRTDPKGSSRRSAPLLLSSESIVDAKDLRVVQSSSNATHDPETSSGDAQPLRTLGLRGFVTTGPRPISPRTDSQLSKSIEQPRPPISTDSVVTQESGATVAATPLAFERRVFLGTAGERLERCLPPHDSPEDSAEQPLAAQLLVALESMANFEPPSAPMEASVATPVEEIVATPNTSELVLTTPEETAATSEPETAVSGLSIFVKAAPVAPPELMSKRRNPFQYLFVPAAVEQPTHHMPMIVATTDNVNRRSETTQGQQEQDEQSGEFLIAENETPEINQINRGEELSILEQPVHFPGLNIPEAQPLIAEPMLVDVTQPISPGAESAEGITTPEPDGLKPIGLVTTRIAPESGEMPRDYATGRFADAGEVRHSMGTSRETEAQFNFQWEAPALCHRALVFEEVNLERYGYKVPLVQPALSAAHFFGSVPLAPYLMASQRTHRCSYTLGHYRPGDDVPYYWYVPPWEWKAGMIEAGTVAGIFFAFP